MLAVRPRNTNRGTVSVLVLVVVADAGDKVMHNDTNILTSLFARGRHLGCAR